MYFVFPFALSLPLNLFELFSDEEQFAITPARLPSRTTRAFEPTPLCKDGYLRPYQLSIVVDATARSTEKVFSFILFIIQI